MCYWCFLVLRVLQVLTGALLKDVWTVAPGDSEASAMLVKVLSCMDAARTLTLTLCYRFK